MTTTEEVDVYVQHLNPKEKQQIMEELELVMNGLLLEPVWYVFAAYHWDCLLSFTLSLPFTIMRCITVLVWLMIWLSLTHSAPHVASLLSLIQLWLIVYHMWLDHDSKYDTCDMSVISDLMLVVPVVRYITCTTKTWDSPSQSSWLVIAVSLPLLILCVISLRPRFSSQALIGLCSSCTKLVM